MSKIWQVIAMSVASLGLALAVVGCGSSRGTAKDKMEGAKTSSEKMDGDKMDHGKMGSDKMDHGKMGNDKMTGANTSADKMSTDKMNKK